jgi:2-C-methyl-D-erythritol 4-phosphate cytidylyltransferase
VSLHLLVPAAGMGVRLESELPKALVPVAGRPLLAWTLDALAGIPFAKGVIVGPPGLDFCREIEKAIRHRWDVVPGGETRARSVEIGFAHLAPGPRDFVVVHDAARPFLEAEEIGRVVAAAEETGAAIAVIPVVDTLKRCTGGRVAETIDREGVVAAATPQVFRADLLRRAIEEAPPGTDEAARLEALGVPIAVVEVSRKAFKVTYPGDLAIAAAIARGRS